MADDIFKLPGSSYDQLSKIIKAYGSLAKEATPKEVGDLLGIDQTTVSRNNAFLVGAGIVEGTRAKRATSLGSSLARALDHDLPSEIQRWWRQVVDDTEFLQKVVSAVRVRKGMDGPTLQTHIAYTAGLKRSATVLAGAGAVTDILQVSGLLVEQDGKYVATSVPSNPDPDMETSKKLDEVLQAVSSGDRVTVPVHAITTEASPTLPISLQLLVRVDCTTAELDELGPKLSRLLRYLSSADED